MVGEIGFEPTTLCSQSRCATRLRYSPKQRVCITVKLVLQPFSYIIRNMTDFLDTELDKITTLEQLKGFVEAYNGCPLKANVTNTVFSDGNSSSDIMFIGEAPGAEEDRLGKPFVGRSGKLLDKMLDAMGLTRKDNIYITNVTFWRPPENRNPTTAELESCRTLVYKHIQLINPKIIVLIGGVSTKHLLQTKIGIMKLRGTWQQLDIKGLKEPILTLPIFHPAYLLRNPPAKKEAWEDFKLLRAKGEELGVSFGPMYTPEDKYY